MGFKKNNHKIVEDRKKAILYALENSRDSIILILGKGTENYQLIKNTRCTHSDVDIVKKYINENKD